MNQHPQFSVIVPTYGRPNPLRRCLKALRELAFPRNDFEVIIVDDGSATAVDQVVTPFQRDLNLRLLEQPHRGPAVARNTGAAHARGDLLAFTDDDCAPHPDWLRAMYSHCIAAPYRMIGGQTHNGLPDNPFSETSQQLISYMYGFYNADAMQARFFASNNLVLPADRFRELGGFDSSFPNAAGEDRDLCDRWRSRGYQMLYAPDAVVYHAHPLTLRRFWHQHFNYGRAAFHVHSRRGERNRSGPRAESMTFYLNLLRYPFSQEACARPWLYAMLLGLSQVATATGLIREAVGRITMRTAS